MIYLAMKYNILRGITVNMWSQEEYSMCITLLIQEFSIEMLVYWSPGGIWYLKECTICFISDSKKHWSVLAFSSIPYLMFQVSTGFCEQRCLFIKFNKLQPMQFVLHVADRALSAYISICRLWSDWWAWFFFCLLFNWRKCM